MTPAPAPLTLRFWGVRGSVPSPGPSTARYGGNTPCVELRAADGRRLVLDAGTGLRVLGHAMRGEPTAEVSVCVSHAHGDHVQGLPFFAPLARPDGRVVLYAGTAQADAVRDGVRAVLVPPLFPQLDGMLDRVRVAALPAAAAGTVAGFSVRAVDVPHPGGASGFVARDAASGRTVAYLPDLELGAVETVGGGRRTLLEGIAGAHVLVHDATYLPSELDAHRGWGHSSYAEAVRLAADARVPRLVLFHHHPSRDDDGVDRLTELARALAREAGAALEVTAAAEGMELAV